MRAGEQTTRAAADMRAVRLTLARHQLRREQGIPTLGVLIGATAEAEAVWREWAQAAGWPVAVREADRGTEKGTPGAATLYLDRTPDTAAATGLAQTVARLCRALDTTTGVEQRKHPVALAVAPGAAARFLGDAPFDRTRTLFAEGSVVLPTAGEPDPDGKQPGSKVGADPSLAQSAPSLARHVLRAAIVADFEAAKAGLHRVEAGLADAAETDRVRSAAERFLADLLADLPETRGLFALNAPLEFCFGPKRTEVDLLAAGLRLAVEIDGYYHFREPDGYRRDRRKDALLQRQGYLVLRFLAEDVVVRLEEVLEEIRTTVAFRRATLG